MKKDYWTDVVEKLNNEKTSNWASHVLSCDLIEECSLDRTNLGEAIKYVPVEMIIQYTINAYANEDCQPYCDLILTSIGKTAIPYLIKNINSNNSRIRESILWVLNDLDKAKSIKLAIDIKRKEKSERVLKLIELIITNTDNKI